MMNPNALLSEQTKLVVGLSNTAPSSSTPDYVSMKNYPKCSIIIVALNGTTVTGSAITVKQATDVAGTSEKAVAFSVARRNIDAAAADALAEFTVTSNTFTTDTTNSKILMYEITINASDLDVAGGFDCIRAGTGNSVNSTLTVLYVLWPASYAKSTPPAAITD